MVKGMVKEAMAANRHMVNKLMVNKLMVNKLMGSNLMGNNLMGNNLMGNNHIITIMLMEKAMEDYQATTLLQSTATEGTGTMEHTIKGL